ncbi:hypothetical protein Taro_027326 [Colocasia esculenta]|uniref:Uncharacterized protein n=1 Tax=Colocasia esculenta TaxID=4460 RepID=A0A843VFE9_COLES|nr:hypothetical protein [Colocasia esculenta]
MYSIEKMAPVESHAASVVLRHSSIRGVAQAVWGTGLSRGWSTSSSSSPPGPYSGADGKVYYGIYRHRARDCCPSGTPTPRPWTSPSTCSVFGDFVHPALSLVVFVVVSLLDSYTVSCYYPAFESNRPEDPAHAHDGAAHGDRRRHQHRVRAASPTPATALYPVTASTTSPPPPPSKTALISAVHCSSLPIFLLVLHAMYLSLICLTVLVS